MKRESRTHAQHPARVAYGKGPDTKFKKCCFLQRAVWALAIRGLSSLEKFGKCNLCNSYRKLFKQIHVYMNCIFLMKISKNNKRDIHRYICTVSSFITALQYVSRNLDHL